MSADTQIESGVPLDPETCRRLVLGNEPWITLRYDERDVQAIVRSAASGNVLLARTGDRTVGFALSSSGILLGEYLKLLVVEPALQSQGIGRKLMADLERRAFRTWPNVYLCVSDFNHGARRFYRRLGYEEIGVLKDLLVPGMGEVLMRKTIASWRGFGGATSDP